MAKKISDAEWREIIRAALVDGVTPYALGKKYGVPAQTIRSRLKSAQIAQVEPLANQIVKLNQEFRQLDDFAQSLTASLSQKLCNISSITADVAEMEAKSAKQLAAIKSTQILNIDPENLTPQSVGIVKILGEMVNDSMKTPLNLITANKDQISKAASADTMKPKSLADFYSQEEAGALIYKPA
jgi:hypothetical protein